MPLPPLLEPSRVVGRPGGSRELVVPRDSIRRGRDTTPALGNVDGVTTRGAGRTTGGGAGSTGGAAGRAGGDCGCTAAASAVASGVGVTASGVGVTASTDDAANETIGSVAAVDAFAPRGGATTGASGRSAAFVGATSGRSVARLEGRDADSGAEVIDTSAGAATVNDDTDSERSAAHAASASAAAPPIPASATRRERVRRWRAITRCDGRVGCSIGDVASPDADESP